MRKLLTVVAVACLTVSASGAVIPLVLQGGDITVTASYKGKGTVDDTHEILVFLFDHPSPTAASEPLDMQVITKNGGSATFKNVTLPSVYVTLVYDEKANYDGRSGPPPDGTPIGSFTKAGKPVPVKPGQGVKVTATFDDSRRFGK